MSFLDRLNDFVIFKNPGEKAFSVNGSPVVGHHFVHPVGFFVKLMSGRLYQRGNPGFWKSLPHRLKTGPRQNGVAQRPQFDNQNSLQFRTPNTKDLTIKNDER